MTRVWIDADACMGAGTCAQIAPDVFQARHDGRGQSRRTPLTSG